MTEDIAPATPETPEPPKTSTLGAAFIDSVALLASAKKTYGLPFDSGVRLLELHISTQLARESWAINARQQESYAPLTALPNTEDEVPAE